MHARLFGTLEYLASQSFTKIQKLAWRPTFLSGKVIINHLYSDLCYKFCQRGFRIGAEPETWTLIQFGTNYFLFLMGQAIANVHIGIWIFPKNLSFQNYKKRNFQLKVRIVNFKSHSIQWGNLNSKVYFSLALVHVK